MTKILNINAVFDKQIQETIYEINVKSCNKSSILIIKDLIDDQENAANIHCIGIALKRLPNLCIKGKLFVKNKQPERQVSMTINTIQKIIQNFIS